MQVQTKWLIVSDAAKTSGYHPEHIRRLARAGKIEGQKIATIWQVDLKTLLAHMRKNAKDKNS